MNEWNKNFIILKEDFIEELTTRVISSSMDLGPSKKRRRTVMRMSIIQFKMSLDLSTFETFKKFYYDNDVLVFKFTRPDTKEIKNVRFVQVPSCSFNGVRWDVIVTLEILP